MATARKKAGRANPQDWLFLNPTPSESGIVFGVLRKTYKGHANTAVEFGRRKLQPIPPLADGAMSPWPVTAEHTEVLLPAEADDLLNDAEALLRQADACAAGHEPALLTYLTLPFHEGDRLHVGWERCRSFVRQHIAQDRGLASLAVLHAPGRAGSSHPPHCHCLIVPRRITRLGLGHGVYDQEMIHDTGQALIEGLWAQYVQAFR